jgi:menaquinone-dependent protoporphyrinogen IX oxidase
MSVLIAYGSRYGSTEEIASRLVGFLDRRIAQSVMVVPSKELGLELDMRGRNDLRDWDRIRDFAHRFAARAT